MSFPNLLEAQDRVIVLDTWAFKIFNRPFANYEQLKTSNPEALSDNQNQTIHDSMTDIVVVCLEYPFAWLPVL